MASRDASLLSNTPPSLMALRCTTNGISPLVVFIVSLMPAARIPSVNCCAVILPSMYCCCNAGNASRAAITESYLCTKLLTSAIPIADSSLSNVVLFAALCAGVALSWSSIYCDVLRPR